MSPDYDMLRGDTGGLPPDGLHDAYLDRAALVDTRSGEMIVTEWRTVGDPLYMWTCWFGLSGQRLGFALDFLDSIGVDRADLADVDGSRLEDALDARIGLVFAVRTKRWGDNGNGGVNVEVEAEGGAQQTLDVPEVPIEPVEPVAAAAGDDEDDIPF